MKREWLDKLLKNKKLTHQEAADLVPMNRAYLTQIINGSRCPSPNLAQRMGIALDFEWTNFFNQNCGVTPQNKQNKTA